MKFDLQNVQLSYVDKREGIRLPTESSERLAEVIGILAGDGHIGSLQSGKDYLIQITSNLKDEVPYLEYVKRLLRDVFNAEFRFQNCVSINTARLMKRSKGIWSFLKSVGYSKKQCLIQVPSWIWENEAETISFVKGIFDTDGCLCLKRNHGKHVFYPVVNITLKDEKVIEMLAKWSGKKDIPYNTGRESYVDKRTNKRYTKFRLQISGYKNTSKWFGLIGTSNPKHQRKMGVAGFEPTATPASAVRSPGLSYTPLYR